MAIPALGRPQVNKPLWSSHLAHPPVPSLPRYTLIHLGWSSGGSPAATGGEAVIGGGAGSLGECESPLSNQRPSRPSVSRTTVGDSVPLTRV